MKYRKKPVVIEATQWFKNGDHPKDESEMIPGKGGPFMSEGKVVRYYRVPENIMSADPCKQCGKKMHDHGWIDTLEGGHIVCPSDWIITGVRGEYYPCKDGIFQETYEQVEEK